MLKAKSPMIEIVWPSQSKPKLRLMNSPGFLTAGVAVVEFIYFAARSTLPSGMGKSAAPPYLCYTAGIPQGRRKFTLVEVASGHDMTALGQASLLVWRSSAQASSGFSHGEWSR